MNFQLEYNRAQDLVIEQPFDQRITAISASLYKPGNTLVTSGLTCSVGSYYALSGACGKSYENASRVLLPSGSLSATDYRRGDAVVIGIPDYTKRGHSERIEVDWYDFQTATSSFVYVMNQLQFDYTTSHAIWSCFHTVSFTTTETATRDENYRLRIIYTCADGTTENVDHYVDVVTVPMRNMVTAELIRRECPDLFEAEYENAVDKTLKQTVDLAYTKVIEDIKARGFKVDRFRDQLVFNRAVISAFRWIYAQHGICPNSWRRDIIEYTRNCGGAYSGAIENLLQNVSFYDDNDDQIVNTDEEDQHMAGWWLSQ